CRDSAVRSLLNYGGVRGVSLSLQANHRIAEPGFRRLGQCSLKQEGQQQLGAGAKRLSFALAAFCLLWPSTVFAQHKQFRRVTILSEGNPSTSPTAVADREIGAALEKPPYLTDIYNDATEIMLFPREAAHRKFWEFNRDRKPHVGIGGPCAVKFMFEFHEKLFLERVSHLPSNAIVLYTSLTHHAAEMDFIRATQSLPMVTSVANAQVLPSLNTQVGQRAVRAYVNSFANEVRA